MWIQALFNPRSKDIALRGLLMERFAYQTEITRVHKSEPL